MTESEFAERQALVAEALSWKGTPYHHEAHVKGHGVDCAQFLHEVFVNAGLIARMEIGHYSCDRHLHSAENGYLERILAHARPVGPPYLPGDVVTYKWGKTAVSHAGIIIEWPDRIIHALLSVGRVSINSATAIPALKKREQAIYRLTGWA